MSDGVTRNITNLKENERYHLFIPAKKQQTCCIELNISLANPEVNSHLYFLVSEYISRNLSCILWSLFKSPRPRLFSRYQIVKNDTQYLEIETPELLFDINYIVAKIDIEYDIIFKKGITEKITDFDYDSPYNLFIPTTPFQKITISLTMDYINEEIFEYIYIQEYESIYNEYLKSEKPIIKNTINGKN